MRLHREGIATIVLVLALNCIVLGSLWSASGIPSWVSALSVAFMLSILALVLWFFRVPSRPMPTDESGVFSPCDGKVVVIERIHEPEHLNGPCVQLSIFMSPINVHANWYPINGIVSYTKYHPGKYLVAWHPKSSSENERSTVVVSHPVFGQVLFRQIAGALARRICTYAQVGAKASAGQEFGFIKFGSRVDVMLPLNARVQVKLGERVKGRVTRLATFDDPQ
jgi:phosphatidylserine decarboxylase